MSGTPSTIDPAGHPRPGTAELPSEALSPDEARAVTAIGADRRVLAHLDRGFLDRLRQRGLLAHLDESLLLAHLAPVRPAPRPSASASVKIERPPGPMRARPALRALRF